MIWRTTWWGAIGGGALGAVYIIGFLVFYDPRLIGMYLVFLPLVLLTGARNGLVVSLVVGPLVGLILGLVTRLWFGSLTDARRYRLVLRAVGAGASLVVAPLAMLLLTAEPISFFVFSREPNSLAYLILYSLPGPVAALAGWWAGNRVASWYIIEELGWDQ